MMVKSWFTKIVGTRFQREMKRIRPVVDATHGHVQDLAGNDAASDAYRRGRFQVEASREDRQPGKKLTLLIREELMAPVQRRPDGLVAGV